jgi:hypothetical protein
MTLKCLFLNCNNIVTWLEKLDGMLVQFSTFFFYFMPFNQTAHATFQHSETFNECLKLDVYCI